MQYKLNILHLGMALGAAGCVRLSMLEASGRSMKPARLFALPLVASLTALIVLFFALGEPLPRRIALAAIVAGLAAGAVRGWRMSLLVDHVFTRLRLPTGRDALWASLLLAAAVVYELAIAVVGRKIAPLHVFPSSAALFCGGYLIARAFAVRLRLHHAPHVDFR